MGPYCIEYSNSGKYHSQLTEITHYVVSSRPTCAVGKIVSNLSVSVSDLGWQMVMLKSVCVHDH